MTDVTILLSTDSEAIELTAFSLAQAKQRMTDAWPKLFPDGPQRQAAALEVIMTGVSETMRAAK